MARSAAEDIFGGIVKRVGEALKPLGVSRRGQIMRIVREGNCGIIGFQRSTSNSREQIKFTVNIGVVCGELLDGERSPGTVDKAALWDAHVSERIGFLLPGHNDKWWEITE